MTDVVLWLVVGALVFAFATDWAPIGSGRLAILAALSTLGYVLHYVAGALGTRQAGGSAWAFVG